MILIINGNPRPDSLTEALADAYQRGASINCDQPIERLDLYQLSFSPVLAHGYHQRTPLEPDLVRAMALLKEADHVVFLYPVWWGSMPALLKGFIDRVFLPGHFFRYHDHGVTWDKLMKGKTARVILSMDAPSWYDRWVYGRPARKAMQRMVLNFCGYRSRFTTLGAVKQRSPAQVEKWLFQVERLAAKEAQKLAQRPQVSAPVAQ